MNISLGLTIGLLILGSLWVSLCVLAYVSWRYLDCLESLMSRSKYVLETREYYSNAGLPGRMIRLISISLALSYSKIGVRKGFVNAEDVKNFPMHIKRRLFLLLYFFHFSLAALILGSYLTPS